MGYKPLYLVNIGVNNSLNFFFSFIFSANFFLCHGSCRSNNDLLRSATFWTSRGPNPPPPLPPPPPPPVFVLFFFSPRLFFLHSALPLLVAFYRPCLITASSCLTVFNTWTSMVSPRPIILNSWTFQWVPRFKSTPWQPNMPS